MSTNAVNNMKWLLKREFWENKGGLFWAPIFTGVIFIGLTLMAMLVGQMSTRRSGIQINNLKLDELIAEMPPEALAHVHLGTQVSLYMIAALLGVVLFFVLFFYCLGALYDERRDRSVLFWKSLPISDRATVASKAATALVVAPLLSNAAAILTGIAFLILLSVYVMFNGVNPIPLLWSSGATFKVAGTLLALIPLQIVWALPTVGWLMLCSSWARSKPFLWAVAVPIGAGVMVSWLDLMQSVSAPDSWFWENIVGRMLLSIAPGSWLDAAVINDEFNRPEDLMRLVDLGTNYAVFATPQLWIGAAAGIAMIALSIRFRRTRDEG